MSIECVRTHVDVLVCQSEAWLMLRVVEGRHILHLCVTPGRVLVEQYGAVRVVATHRIGGIGVEPRAVETVP